MKALKAILIVLVSLVALLFIISFLLPNKTHVERKGIVHAPPSTVYGIVNDLHSWTKWDAWSSKDPNMTVKFEGPETGVNSKRIWESKDKNVGSGNMIITANEPNKKITTLLDFGLASKPNATFDFKEVPEGTEVTWSMDMTFEGFAPKRYFGLIMDKMVGGDYEKGLANLDAYVKTLPPPAPPTAAVPATDSTAASVAK